VHAAVSSLVTVLVALLMRSLRPRQAFFSPASDT
jgi:hypothetical protein